MGTDKERGADAGTTTTTNGAAARLACRGAREACPGPSSGAEAPPPCCQTAYEGANSKLENLEQSIKTGRLMSLLVASSGRRGAATLLYSGELLLSTPQHSKPEIRFNSFLLFISFQTSKTYRPQSLPTRPLDAGIPRANSCQ